MLPHRGFPACRSHDPPGDEHFTGKFHLAYESTPRIGDVIPACARQDIPRFLRPGKEQAFWIWLALEDI